MAATPYELSEAGGSSFVFDIYDENLAATAATNSTTPVSRESRLPDGPCNFVDLTHSSSGAQCGCRRFWGQNNTLASSSIGGLDPNTSATNVYDLGQAGWCMCSHHACFHDQVPSLVRPDEAMMDRGRSMPPMIPTGAAAVTGYINESTVGGTARAIATKTPAGLSSAVVMDQQTDQSRVSRAPLSALQDLTAVSFLPGSAFACVDDVLMGAEPEPGKRTAFLGPPQDSYRLMARPPTTEKGLEDLGDSTIDATSPFPPLIAVETAPSRPTLPSAPIPRADSYCSIADTLSWGRQEPSEQDGHSTQSLSYRPSQYGDSPQPAPSSALSSIGRRYLRPFSGKGLHTLGSATPLKLSAEGAADYASPKASLRDSKRKPPDLRRMSPHMDLSCASSSMRAEHREPAAGWSGTLRAHELRLERLENPSISFQLSHEECQEKHEHLDVRVMELESRVEEVEKRLNSDDTSTVLGKTSRDDDVTESTVSMATSRVSSITSGPGYAFMYKQLQSLQATIDSLQAKALPFHNQQWELEVVYLPFPLKGIWAEANQFPVHTPTALASNDPQRQSGDYDDEVNVEGADDRTRKMFQNATRANSSSHFPIMFGGARDEWETAGVSASSELPRLFPRACAPGRVLDDRLRSCGLVRKLLIRGSDAHSFQAAMSSTFRDVFDAMEAHLPLEIDQGDSTTWFSSKAAGKPQSQLFGLGQKWVPLRKIHKEARLQFLTLAEMVSPTLWDANFLVSSVVMKAAGLHRLYVTQPGAYVQSQNAYKFGWSWQRLYAACHSAQVSGSLGHASSVNSLGDSTYRLKTTKTNEREPCWAWDSRLDDPPSPASARLQSSSTCLSKGTTPVQHGRHGKPTTGHILSRSASEVSDGMHQFFTASQSPLHPMPSTHGVIRRSRSPSLPTSSNARHPSTSTSYRPPAFYSMPTSAQSAHDVTTSLVSPYESTIGKRRVHAAGHRISSSSSLRDRRERSVLSTSTPTYSGSSAHPPTRTGGLSMLSKRTSASSSGGMGAFTGFNRGVVKRRSTRSPSLFWPRNTPRRSTSRSPGILAPLNMRAGYSPTGPSSASGDASAADGRIRGTTPFCYATPYSNAPAMDTPISRRHGHPLLLAPGPFGSDFDDGEMVEGYISDGNDYPMAQDDDDGKDDDDFDIEVYEDAANDPGGIETAYTLGGIGRRNETMQTNHSPEQSSIAPEDEPWPGIEDDDALQVCSEDGDERMPDSENMENMDPSSAGSEIQMLDSAGQGSPSSSSASKSHCEELFGGLNGRPNEGVSCSSQPDPDDSSIQRDSRNDAYDSDENNWLKNDHDDDDSSGFFKIHED